MSTEAPERKRDAKADESPPGYRGGLFDHIDVPSITSFAACLLLFVLLLVGVRSVDYSELNKPNLEDLSDRVSKIIMPLKPLGKDDFFKSEAEKKAAAAKPRPVPPKNPGDAKAFARIERSRHTASEQIVRVQERITKAAVLNILSGKGPGSAGKSVGRQGRSGGDGLAGLGDLDSRLGNLEGLTKFDGKKGDFNQDGAPPPRKGDDVATTGIDKMVKGFENAKSSVLSKIGVAEAEPIEQMDRSAKFTGNRSANEVAAFISKKQSMVSMLYEETLKSNPALEGKVTVIMVIEEDGTVSNVSVLRSETTLDDPDFTAELLRRIKRWIFPPSGGGPVEMKSPFVFKPA